MEFGELHPLTLAFRSREMEREYWARRVPRMRGRTVIAVGLVLVLYPWSVPEIVRQAWLIRGLILALCVALPLELRIGLASGPVVAGVIGRKKFQYDVWGEAVNTASRMESHGLPGQIQVTAAARELIRGSFLCRHRGRISVKGIGPMDAWLLLGRREERRETR